MTFEKDFPELSTLMEVIDESDRLQIQRWCLDKQKVRDAMRKCQKTLYGFSDGGDIIGIDMTDLWEELGL